jgi:hypothetical protein
MLSLLGEVKAPRFGDNRKSIRRFRRAIFTDKLDVKLNSTRSFIITEDTDVLNGERSKGSIKSQCERISHVIICLTTSKYDKTSAGTAGEA